MLRLGPVRRDYAWGSTTAIPRLIGAEPDGRPVAELWFGAHPSAPSPVLRREEAGTGDPGAATGAGDATGAAATASAAAVTGTLRSLVEQAPEQALGRDVLARFGPRLPFLLKLIAPARPLSLQVHPGTERARAGFALEDAAGIPRDGPTRNYRDPHHKPELIYAVTTFEALSGFRAPRRAAELLDGLDAPLARRLLAALRRDPTRSGVRTVFALLLDARSRPTPSEVAEVVTACAARAVAGSPSTRADAVVALLAEHFPGDPGVVVSLLLNPVTLHPGQAMFIPAGSVHAYLSGIGVELMANSDNVLRAALTSKHADVPELLDVVEYVAAPPIRIAPETFRPGTRVYYAPVDDFELSVVDVGADPAAGPATDEVAGVLLRPASRGPRVLVVLAGEVRVRAEASPGEEVLRPGEGLFVADTEGRLRVGGSGTLVVAGVP